MKKLLIVLVLAIIVGIIVFFYWRSQVKAPTSSEISSNLNKATSSTQLPDTISVEVLKPGFGAAARDGDVVTVNYIGYLPNGKVFDSSYSRGTPFSFTLGSENIIKGWNLGILGMKVGEKIKLTIPPNLGYGSSGAGNGLIPPNSSLIFEIELLKIN